MNSLTILLIEDHPDDARFIIDLLHQANRFKPVVTTSETLAGATRLLSRNVYDIILLDLNLPDSKGIDTFASVFSHSRSAPVVVLTNLDEQELASYTVKQGAQDFLIKREAGGELLQRTVWYAIERKYMKRRLIHLNQVLRTVQSIDK